MRHSGWKDRINALFQTQIPPEVDTENMGLYLRYMRERIRHPCYLVQSQEDETGFDALLVLELLEEVDAEQGILVRVSRSSDGRELVLPLAQLECCQEGSSNSELVDDFGRWFMFALLKRMGVS